MHAGYGLCPGLGALASKCLPLQTPPHLRDSAEIPPKRLGSSKLHDSCQGRYSRAAGPASQTGGWGLTAIAYRWGLLPVLLELAVCPWQQQSVKGRGGRHSG